MSAAWQSKPWVKRFRALATLVITCVVGAVIGHFLEPLMKNIEAKDLYVAVIMSPNSPLSSVSKKFLEGLHAKENGRSFLSGANGIKVPIVEFDDLDNVVDAERYAQKLLNDQNCVLVIGNSSSTLTAVSLDVFMRQSQTAPSLIMPIATADELLIRAKAAGYDAILRMPPPDKDQAELIVKLALKVGTASAARKGQGSRQQVALYGDGANSVYSSNLLRLVAEKSRARGIGVLTEDLLGVQHSIYSSLAAWNKLAAPSVVIYLGNTHQALLLCDQLRGLGKTMPIVFSDGCMTEEMLQYMRTFPNECFITSPLSLKGINGKGEERALTYQPYGEDAFVLIEKILQSVPSVSRAEIAHYIQSKRPEIVLRDGAAGSYRFSEDGNNADIRFHGYRITGGKLKQYDIE